MIGTSRVRYGVVGLVWSIAVVVVVLGLSVASALGARGHVFAGSFGAPGSGPGQFGEAVGVAVNEATKDVYVLDKANNRVEVFNANGSKFEGEFNGSGLGLGMMGSGQLLNEGKEAGSGGLPEEVPNGQFDEPVGIAIDNDPSSPSHGDVYVADTHGQAESIPGTEVVDKFSATGEYIGQITHNPDGEPYSELGFRVVLGVAVDPHGEVWVQEHNFGSSPYGVANYSNAVVNAWIAFRSRHWVNGFLGGSQPGLAVDSEDNFYGTGDYSPETTLRPAKFNEKGELTIAEVDEEAPTGFAVELSTNDAYFSHSTNVHRVDANGKSLEILSVPGGHGSGVAVNSEALTVYVADSVAGVVYVFGPEPAGVPRVSSGSESVNDVTATSASFSAEVNPRSEPGEGATSYSFVYGPCDTPTTCKSSPYVDSTPVPEGRLAPNYEPDLVTAHPQDLVAHTAYHMRVVAHNSHLGIAEGEEVTFTTQATGGFSLPDGRQWELVSPANKYGAGIEARAYLTQASESGDAIVYDANAPIEAQPPSNHNSIVAALAGRGAAGWRSLNISGPHSTAPGSGTPPEYPLFSSDLSVGLLQPAGAFEPSLSSEASEQTPFLRSDFPAGDPGHLCTSSCYTPLVSGAPGVENVPPGTVFGGEAYSGGECRLSCGPEFVGASPDMTHVILKYRWTSLVEDAPVGSLYEWSGGRLSVVSVLPDESLTGGTLGQARAGNGSIVRNAVSTDGSRVVWSDGPHLYLRDSAKEKTVQLDVVQGGTGAVSAGGPDFQAASSDDSRVFFMDSQQLTKDASGAPDLYECEVVEEAGELKCKLTNLTASASGASGVMAPIPGVSEDGSYAYFVATGDLTGTQANDRGETAVAGEHNLYVRQGGVTRLVAVLSAGQDSTDWSGDLDGLTAGASPDGRWFSFMSDRPLTGFDNRDAISGKRDEEVFLYRAGDRGEDTLVCASCDPTGGQPHGILVEEKDRNLFIAAGGYGDSGNNLAAYLPAWTTNRYRSRYISNSGRLFFNSIDSLVPQDTNAAEDVYQFEPVGTGGCTADSTAFVVASDGCVGLISSGTSEEGSAFLDASESGGDTFFLSTAQLSLLDTDSALDIYDAHECSGSGGCVSPVTVPVPACEGDACQSPVAPPEDPTPGSLTYQGPGNPPGSLLGAKPKQKAKTIRCRKGNVKRHGRCVKKSTTRTKAKRSKNGKGN